MTESIDREETASHSVLNTPDIFHPILVMKCHSSEHFVSTLSVSSLSRETRLGSCKAGSPAAVLPQTPRHPQGGLSQAPLRPSQTPKTPLLLHPAPLPFPLFMLFLLSFSCPLKEWAILHYIYSITQHRGRHHRHETSVVTQGSVVRWALCSGLHALLLP